MDSLPSSLVRQMQQLHLAGRHEEAEEALTQHLMRAEPPGKGAAEELIFSHMQLVEAQVGACLATGGRQPPAAVCANSCSRAP
jgi:hypothetical protein